MQLINNVYLNAVSSRSAHIILLCI